MLLIKAPVLPFFSTTFSSMTSSTSASGILNERIRGKIPEDD